MPLSIMWGRCDYDVSGQAQRRIALGPQDGSINVTAYPQGSYRWDIGLAEGVDLDLKTDVGSGDATMDLAKLALTRLDLNGGSGDVDLLLPQRAYALDYDGGSGDLTMDVAANSAATLTMQTGSGKVQVMVGPEADTTLELRNGGSGHFSVLVPRNAAVRVEVRMPAQARCSCRETLSRQSGQDKTGVWETAGYDSASHKISIVAGNLGSGDLVVSYR